MLPCVKTLLAECYHAGHTNIARNPSLLVCFLVRPGFWISVWNLCIFKHWQLIQTFKNPVQAKWNMCKVLPAMWHHQGVSSVSTTILLTVSGTVSILLSRGPSFPSLSSSTIPSAKLPGRSTPVLSHPPLLSFHTETSYLFPPPSSPPPRRA